MGLKDDPGLRRAVRHARGPTFVLYTDGGCDPNPGPGGWGAVIVPPAGEVRELSGGEPFTTNNRMELTAALAALKAVPEGSHVTLTTDSEYLKRGITEWLPAWRRRGWRTSGGGAVANRDLWEALHTEAAARVVRWRWTRGHAGDQLNERADQLATAARARRERPPDAGDVVQIHVAVAAPKGVGGWGAVLSRGGHARELAGTVDPPTANRLFLAAAAAALAALKGPRSATVWATSAYLVDGARLWLAGWQRRGWRTIEGKPVANRDLWEEVARLVGRHRVSWREVDRGARPAELARAQELAEAATRERPQPPGQSPHLPEQGGSP